MIKRREKKSLPVRLVLLLLKAAVLTVILVVGINLFVIKSTEGNIAASVESKTDEVSDSEIERLKSINPECIVVLGAALNKDGSPSKMLENRLDLSIELYKKGVAPKLLFSGDNGQVVYNEVDAMKNYAVNAGVPKEDIFLDHAGFSTYESVYRANHIFKVESMVVVTQKYHLYRALYGCRRLNIQALGAASDQKVYKGQDMREIREIMARDKDFVKWIFKPQPTFMGDEISIKGSGVYTQ